MIDTNVSDFSKLKCTVMSIFKLNQTYSGKEIKEILNKVYKQFEISKAPKANDLQEFAKIKIIKNKPSGFQLIEYYK
jgi:inorganic pyrophosphatase/exopolyphosphatase